MQRFVDAQAPVYASVCAELAAGRKRSHWMWFVFPQLRGLGHSAMADRYGLASDVEARQYWQHPVLGPRLLHCTRLVLDTRGRTARDIFGSPDDLKLCSCMTLFREIASGQAEFGQALQRFYGGQADGRTLELLARRP
jgi:uncharacterized protein (DUF1810 family)